jgi:hypothetical protein
MFQLDSRLRPIVIELAEVQLDNQVAEMVNQVCQDLEEGGQLTYNDIMQVVYDQDGQVIAMEADTDTINLLRTKLGNEVATGLGDMERQLVFRSHWYGVSCAAVVRSRASCFRGNSPHRSGKCFRYQ